MPPERRAGLRRLRAEFERAFDAMGQDRNPSSPAFRAADARYRAWIGALDAVALSLLDDIDAFEAASPDPGPAPGTGPVAAPAGPGQADVDGLFAGIEDLKRSVDLIGAAPAPGCAPEASREASARARAKGVVGQDRAARLRSFRLGVESPTRA